MKPHPESDSLPAWRSSLTDYPPTSRFVDIDGWRMHYVDEGSATGEPVLMVHGNPTWSWYWRHLMAALQPRYRAIAIDHLGCGLSDKPDDLPYTLNRRIDHLQQLVRELNLQHITLVVHDWGGAIGLGAALSELQRYRRFVLLNTGAFPPRRFPWRIRACRTPLLGRWAVQGGNLFARAATRMASNQPGGLSAEVRRGLLLPWDSWNHRRAIYEFVTDIPTRNNQPTMQRLREIDQQLDRLSGYPVALLWGMKDWCFDEWCLRRFQQRLPHAEVREYADAGHYVMEDARREVIRDVVEFLDRTS